MSLQSKPRSRSVFQNYENFEAWQEIPESTHCNLLQRLNKNLSSYENKYKKYMNIRENEMKQLGKFHHQLKDEQNDPTDNSPFLPNINMDHNFIRHSQNMPKPKVLVSRQNPIKQEEIFCDRTNNNLKLKTISFDKTSKARLPVERRKYSLNDHKPQEIEKFFYKHQIEQNHETQNAQLSIFKVDTSNKMEGYKQLRYRLKKAANRSKIVHEQKSQKLRQKEQKENAPLKKVQQKRLSTIIRNIQDECLSSKINEFSDKKFYQQNIRQKYRLHR